MGAAALVAIAVGAATPGRTVRAPLSAMPSAAGRLEISYSTDRELAAALRTTPAVVVRRLAPLHVAELRVAHPVAAAARLRRAPGIGFVRRPADRLSAVDPAAASLPAAPEWQYRAIGEDALPATALHAASSMLIAVIDTGADLGAPALAAKSPRVYNTRTGTGDVRDANGHGTFVASIAAGAVTNAGGMTGAGGDAQLLVVKSARADGTFTDMDEAAGILYAVDHGARIVNLSVGGPSTSQTERRAIQYALDRGVLLVAAVGNEAAKGNPVEYPAALLQPVGSYGAGGAGLAVAGSTPTGGRAPFSNTGSWVSLAAPGESILGAVSALSSPGVYPRTQLPGAPAGLYGYASGTSFATPQVAGAAALVWAANPSLTAAQVAQILKQTASGGGRWTPALGFGVIDVAAALARAQAGGGGILLSGGRVGSRVHLAWSGGAGAYTLSLTTDARPARVVLSSTPLTSTWLTLARGHVYRFAVSALGSDGTPGEQSLPLTIDARR